MNCPYCNEKTKDSRCCNTSCKAYSYKVVEDGPILGPENGVEYKPPKQTEMVIDDEDIPEGYEACPECGGAGWEMIWYGGMSTEKYCEYCRGDSVVESEEE